MSRLVRQVSDWWAEHGYEVVLGLMVTAAVALVAALVWSWRRGRVDRWVSTVTGLAVLGLSAEGMWVVARERLHLPVVLAASVFFVAEAALAQSALQATRHYERTTQRDSDGRMVAPGTPGKHGRAVWVIASVAGVIVSLNSKSFVEALLRLALPLTAALLWWNSLTAEGTSEKERSSWRWTPRRLLLAVGALEPGDRDVQTIHRDRIATAMTVSATRYHAGGWLARLHAARLRRLARSADDALVAEVACRVERVEHITALTAPGAAAVERTATGEVAELRREMAGLRDERAQEVTELREALATEHQRGEAAVAELREDYRKARAEAVALRGDRDRLHRELADLRSADRPAAPAAGALVRTYTAAAAAPARVQAPVGDGDHGGRARLTALLAQRVPVDRVPVLVDGERMPPWFAALVGEAADAVGITRKAALKYAREWAGQIAEQRSVSVK